MSDASLLAFAIRNPGRLVLNPTSTTVRGSDGMYGGSALGVRRAASVAWLTREQEVLDPGNGSLKAVRRRGQERARLFWIVEPPWDSRVLAKLYSSTSSTSGFQRVEGRSAMVPDVAPLAPVAFIADDPTGLSVYFVMPIPRLTAAQAAALTIDDHAFLPIVFDAGAGISTSDAGYPTTPSVPFYQVCPWADVTLVS